jgi:hypothetical protein
MRGLPSHLRQLSIWWLWVADHVMDLPREMRRALSPEQALREIPRADSVVTGACALVKCRGRGKLC